MNTGVYKCSRAVGTLKIRVKLRELLPTVTSSSQENLDTDSTVNPANEQTFEWQQKIFSPYEVNYFKDLANCTTDLEKAYHELIISEQYQSDNRLFSYINDDHFDKDLELNCTTESTPLASELYKNMTKLRLNQTYGTATEKCPAYPYREYEIMYIMADMTTDSLLDSMMRKEYVLCVLKWHHQTNTLSIYPNLSKTKDDPYIIETDYDTKKIFHYWIEDVSSDVSEKIILQEHTLLRNLNRCGKDQNKYNKSDFNLPPKHELVVHVFLEIQSVKNFEYDNNYVQFCVDVPQHWLIKGDKEMSFYGVTHCVKTKGADNKAMIGFPFYIELSYDLRNSADKFDLLIPTPTIYFEVISQNSWNRHRTEGYAYISIPVNQPGIYQKELQCILVEPKGPWGELQRFFVGGCSLLDDVTWLGIPTNHQDSVLNKHGIRTKGTGLLDIKLGIVRQSQEYYKSHLNNEPDQQASRVPNRKHRNSSSIVKSIDEIMQAFQEARENMKKIRQQFQQENPEFTKR